MVWNAHPHTNGSLAGSTREALAERFLRQGAAPAVRRAAPAGTGSALPERVVHNDDFPASLNTNDDWIRTRTGIRERRIAGPEETSFTLGLKAAQEALTSAGVTPRDIDLIIFAT